MIDILMIFPSGGDVFYKNFKYHLGSAYIIAYLRKHGYSAEQFVTEDSFNVKETINKIIRIVPKIVGFSVYESNYMQCVLLANGLKAYNSDIIIIFGGPTPSVYSKQILKSINSVDICVRQEGEEVLVDLLSALSKTNFTLNPVSLFRIKGITFRNENKIIKNSDSNILYSNRFTKNYLDKYPSPYLSKVIPTSNAVFTGIITARGCNQNCTYCNCAILSKRNIFFHSINRVIEELTYLSKYKRFLVPVPIYDDTFTIVPSRAKKICEAIIKNNIELPLLCITRCDKISEKLLVLMKKAGFNSVGFSLESAVPRVLRAIGKVNPPQIGYSNYEKEIEFIKKLKYMTSYAKKIGIKKVFTSIMVGLPGETIQDAQKTIEFVKQLDIDYYSHNFLYIYKGTPLYRNRKKYKYKITAVGKKNKIITWNNFPFDVYKIKLADKSNKIQNSKIIDYNTLKILSLNLKRKKAKSFFDNVIIISDIIKPSLVKWMQENLAINGTIIHIYSNKLKFLKYHKRNEATLYNEFSPSKCYECYYRENSDHFSIFKSGRMALYREEIGIPIKINFTSSTLYDYKKGTPNMQYFISQDREINDIKTLYDLLLEISKSGDSFNYLLDSRPLPQFQDICRWTVDQANCHKLETAIVSDDDTIRICWHSTPVGKIDESFLDINRNIQRLKDELIDRRNCSGCNKNDTCVKCLFPSPLSPKEYCKYKNMFDTEKPAKLINIFNLIKDFLFKPINLYD
ncbi:MAG: B12-binding domain-containing radical SAM protein [Promethearchaeota archaeon]